jgi:hypothetical protein
MKIDVYTKVVLTTIATCLIWISLRDLPIGTTVSAQYGQPQAQSVVIAGWNLGGPIPVSVSNVVVPVTISGIKQGPGYDGVPLPWEPIKVTETPQLQKQNATHKGH